jgi:transcription elongation GreA/GreB family factor
VSKAFTKDDDGTPPPPVRKRGVPVPTDVPNYITADGERTLRAELAGLQTGGDDRAHEISEHLATAMVIGPPDDRSRVAFGATVTVEGENGKRVKYRLVGAIEASPRDGAIYWMSPIAEELHDAQVGDSVTLPKGDFDVVAIDW